MRCTNKQIYRRKKRRGLHIAPIFVLFLLVVGVGIGTYVKKNQPDIFEYEIAKYGTGIFCKELPVDDLCVATENVLSETFELEGDFHSVALFSPNSSTVLYANNIHERIYPASTTKILTMYVALKYGTLTDTVTVSANAVGVPLDSSRAGFKTGDQVSLEALLYSLMLPSGNDSAVAIAEHISGSVEEFMNLMNEEAKKLGATNTNFTSPHGYQDEKHYTTAYDLYLIFNECVKQDKFLEIVSSSEYKTKVTQANGTYRDVTWKQSNQYVNGLRKSPEGISVIGGKTGTTNEAGACLILYSKKSDMPYISIVMGADTRPILYDTMSSLLSSINE